MEETLGKGEGEIVMSVTRSELELVVDVGPL